MAFWDPELLAQEFYDFLIGLAIDWRGGDPQFQSIFQNFCELRFRGPWLRQNPQNYALFSRGYVGWSHFVLYMNS